MLQTPISWNQLVNSRGIRCLPPHHILNVLLLTLTVIFSRIGIAQESRPMAYVIDLSGEWRDTTTDHPLMPLSVLTLDSGLRLVPRPGETPPLIHLRFLDGLCEDTIECSDATPCSRAFSIKQRYSLLAGCREKSVPWTRAIVAAWTGFFGSTAEHQPALAITMSRGLGGDDEEGDDPVLQEAVLLVDGGRIELEPLFRKAANGVFSLQFCDPGPALSDSCSESAEKDRIAVRIVNGRPRPASFTKPEGLYRLELWKKTPNGEQPTERTANVLIGAKSSYAETQRTFLEIARPATELARTDPMIRLMLSAWLARNQRKNTP